MSNYRNPLTLEVSLSGAEFADTDTPGTITIRYLNSNGYLKSETLSFDAVEECVVQALDLLSHITVTEVRTAGWAGGTLNITIETPKLTHEDLQRLGKPIKTVEMFWDDQMWTVKVWDGKPLDIEVAHLKILEQYMDQEKDGVAMDERDRAVANLLLGKLMYDPPFSYMGEGEGSPIEARSSIMIDALCNAYASVNNPTEDAIYQVTVRRGIPADAFALLNTFEWYPVGGKQKKYVDMSEDELAAVVAQKAAERQVLVPAMILDPVLSYQGSRCNRGGCRGDSRHRKSQRRIRILLNTCRSVLLETLFEAHRVTNIPEAGLKSLQRFLSASDADTTGTEERGESVGE